MKHALVALTIVWIVGAAIYMTRSESLTLGLEWPWRLAGRMRRNAEAGRPLLTDVRRTDGPALVSAVR